MIKVEVELKVGNNSNRYRKWLRLVKSEHGGMTLEATLAAPFFMAFVLALICAVRLTVADMALQHAVTEAVKHMTSNAYPAELLAKEAASMYAASPVGTVTEQLLGHIRSARDLLLQGEQWADDYRAFVPDLVVSWMEWERRKREQAELLTREQYERFLEETIDPLVRAAFKEAVYTYADETVLAKDRLSVTGVRLPDLASGTDKLLEIEAEYTVKLPVPFLDRTVKIRKRASERIWVGA